MFPGAAETFLYWIGRALIKKIQIKILGPIIYYVNTEIFGRQLATQVRGPYTVTKDLILVAKWRQK